MRILDIPADLLKKYIYVASNLLGGNSHSINGPNLQSSNRITTSLGSSDPVVTWGTDEGLGRSKGGLFNKRKLIVLVVGQGAG
jgi:hypothetical protein